MYWFLLSFTYKLIVDELQLVRCEIFMPVSSLLAMEASKSGEKQEGWPVFTSYSYYSYSINYAQLIPDVDTEEAGQGTGKLGSLGDFDNEFIQQILLHADRETAIGEAGTEVNQGI